MLSQKKNTNAKKAIVTDGLWRKSVSAIRSLGKSGFDVTVMGDTRFTAGFWSRFARHRYLSPSAADDPTGFGVVLKRILTTYPDNVILPMEDASLKWVAENALDLHSIKGIALLPSLQAIEATQDKGKTITIARELGLPVPNTILSANRQDFISKVLQLEKEEFVVKPKTGTGSAGVVYNGNYDADGWENHWRKFGPMLIQERIPASGKGQGVSILMDGNGDCVAFFAHERLQQYPNSGGPSTDRQSIHAPELVEWSIALLKKLDWRGIAMVEWKVDPRDGKPKLMEINPRFWGSLELAVRSGVDFPTLYAKCALGEKVEKVTNYSVGVRCRWMMPGEVLRYLTQERSKRESIFKFLRGLPKLAEEWDWRDFRGTFAVLFCTAVLALSPRYWKYVRRG